MDFEDGLIQADSQSAIQSEMLADVRNVWTDDINDDEAAVIFLFYTAIAARLASIQDAIAKLDRQHTLRYATGDSLDLLAEQIGVTRNEAVDATGEVTFSRSSDASTDYTIPSGTVVQTDALDPVKFETTETATLSSGTSKVSGVPVRAKKGGTQGNLGADTLVVMPDPPTGIESVTNPSKTSGGEDREPDDNFRSRIADELSKGVRATRKALVSQLLKVDNVISATTFVDEANTSTECVVEGGANQDIAEQILDTKAAAEGTHGGNHGSKVSVDVSVNETSTETINFSRPAIVDIYVDVDVDKGDTYAGDDVVEDAIVQYIGGVLTTGDEEAGDLKAGDDVVYLKVMNAVLNVEGVTDVANLDVGTNSTPTGTSNISIASNERASIDASAGNISVS